MSGKYQYIKDVFPLENFEGMEIENHSSVEKVKDIAYECGWNGGKTEKDRKFLSDLKLLLTEYNDLPFTELKEFVKCFYGNIMYVLLFLHICEPKEIERAKQEFGAKTILVKRDSVEHITSNMADKGVFDYNYDIVINNSGTKDDFKMIAEEFIKDFCRDTLKSEYGPASN